MGRGKKQYRNEQIEKGYIKMEIVEKREVDEGFVVNERVRICTHTERSNKG
jgi:hypothetical protein